MRSNLNKDLVFLMAIQVVAIVFFVGIGASVYTLIQEISKCSVVVHKSIPSPDASRLAVVHEMGCGATVGFNTQVSIAPADRTFSRDRNPSFFSIRGQHDLAVRWVSDKVIEIEVPKAETIYGNDARVGDVTVEYK